MTLKMVIAQNFSDQNIPMKMKKLNIAPMALAKELSPIVLALLMLSQDAVIIQKPRTIMHCMGMAMSKMS